MSAGPDGSCYVFAKGFFRPKARRPLFFFVCCCIMLMVLWWNAKQTTVFRPFHRYPVPTRQTSEWEANGKKGGGEENHHNQWWGNGLTKKKRCREKAIGRRLFLGRDDERLPVVCVYVFVCGAMGRKEANTSGLKRAPNCGHRAVCVRFVGKAHNFPTIIPSALSFPPPQPAQECIGEAYEKGNGRDAMKKQCSPTVSPALPFFHWNLLFHPHTRSAEIPFMMARKTGRRGRDGQAFGRTITVSHNRNRIVTFQ